MENQQEERGEGNLFQCCFLSHGLVSQQNPTPTSGISQQLLPRVCVSLNLQLGHRRSLGFPREACSHALPVTAVGTSHTILGVTEPGEITNAVSCSSREHLPPR